MKKNLEIILKRDGRRCGIHLLGSGCCGLILESEATVDHIIPKSFYRRISGKVNTNPQVWEGSWNRQPMHKSCNCKKGGQLWGLPKFICKCHHTYITEGGEMRICYKQGNEWKYAVLVTDLNPVKFDSSRILPRVRAMLDKKHKCQTAELGEQGHGRGHLIMGFYILQRIVKNAGELYRAERFELCAKECGEFQDLLNEVGVDYMRAEFENLSRGQDKPLDPEGIMSDMAGLKVVTEGIVARGLNSPWAAYLGVTFPLIK